MSVYCVFFKYTVLMLKCMCNVFFYYLYYFNSNATPCKHAAVTKRFPNVINIVNVIYKMKTF